MPTILEYRDVVGFPGYMVGSDGSVWSYWKQCGFAPSQIGDTPRQLSPGVVYKDWLNHKHPYLQAHLYKNGQRHDIYVHQIVLTAFVGPCPPGMEVCHNDGNGTNNWLYNLYWGTHPENMADQIRHGTDPVGSRNGRALLTEADIPVIRQLRAQGFSQANVAQRFNVSIGTIKMIDRGITWRHTVPDDFQIPELQGKGSKHYRAKLTEDDIPKIRSLLAQGITQTEVARRFGVTQSTIGGIALGITWTHVP